MRKIKILGSILAIGLLGAACGGASSAIAPTAKPASTTTPPTTVVAAQPTTKPVVVNKNQSHAVCIALLQLNTDDVEGETSVSNSFFAEWKLDAKALANNMARSGSPWITEGRKWAGLVKVGGIASPAAEAYVASLKGQCNGVATPTTIAPTVPSTTVAQASAPSPNPNVVSFCKSAIQVSDDVEAVAQGNSPSTATLDSDATTMGEDAVLAGGQWLTESGAVSDAMSAENLVTTANDLTEIMNQCTNYANQFS